MMLQLSGKITIEDTVFNAFTSIEAESSWQDLVDTCVIQVTNSFIKDGRPVTVGDDGFFKRGDSVKVEVGYFPNLVTVFEGYIRKIYVDTIVIIECEDAAFLLKQATVTKSFKKTSLDNLIKSIAPDVQSESVDADLGQFRITRATPLQVLEELRKTYGLQSWFRGSTLRAGLAYYTEDQVTHIFDLEKNVVDATGLEFIGSDELKMAVKGLLKKGDEVQELFTYYETKDNITIVEEQPEGFELTDTIEIHEADGEDSRSSVELMMKHMLQNRLSTGVRGSFVAFLEPAVKHGDVVELRSKKFPEREGKFLVKRVKTTASVDEGGVQEISIDRKVG